MGQLSHICIWTPSLRRWVGETVGQTTLSAPCPRPRTSGPIGFLWNSRSLQPLRPMRHGAAESLIPPQRFPEAISLSDLKRCR
eukprot:gene9193-biopygen1651